jgi:glycosyltransferase involved in cell wall biosynthesis
MTDPLVSVIVPCADSTELANVFRWPEWAETLFQFEPGIGAARNAGAARAKAPVLAFMDADVKLWGDLEHVASIPDMDAVWTPEMYLYDGDDKFTQMGVLGLNLLGEAVRQAGSGFLSKLRRETVASLLVCPKKFFRPFDDEKNEDVRWGLKFPRVYPLPIRVEFLRPWTGPMNWRRRRGEPV